MAPVGDTHHRDGWVVHGALGTVLSLSGACRISDLQVRGLGSDQRRTASLTVFRIGDHTNVSGFFWDGSVNDPLAWTAFGCFSSESTQTYVREGRQIVCSGTVLSEIPDDAFPGQMFLPLCRSIPPTTGATRGYSLIGDGAAQIEGRACLTLLAVDAALPDGTPGGFVHIEEKVEGAPSRHFYFDEKMQLICSVWGPGCWSRLVASSSMARAGCDETWPTLDRVWPRS